MGPADRRSDGHAASGDFSATSGRPVERQQRDRYIVDLLVYLLLAVLAVTVQCRSGAYHSDLSLDSDESAHAVSCLMVHDYLALASLRNPFSFARNFQNHYSKVAIGHWPPLFYTAEGFWMCLFGRTLRSMLTFVALCGTLLTWSVYFELRKRMPAFIAFLAPCTLVFSLPFQQMISAVKPDLLLALLIFWASIFAGRYMFGERRRDGIWFLVLMMCACLVHGRGAVLVLVPFVLFPFTERKLSWRWIAAGIAVASMFLIPPRIQQGYHLTGKSIAAGLHEIALYCRDHWEFLPFLLAGLSFAFRDKQKNGFWTAMASLFVSSVLFYLLVPVGWDDYRLVTVLPAVVALAAGGVAFAVDLLQELSPKSTPWLTAGIGAALLFAAILGLKRVERKPDTGFHIRVAQGVLRESAAVLIAADSRHEGALIADGALDDPNLDRSVFRSSKSLAKMSWSGDEYKQRFASADEVAQLLNLHRVSLVVIQTNTRARPEFAQIRNALELSGGWTFCSIGALDIYAREPAHSAMLLCSGRS